MEYKRYPLEVGHEFRVVTADGEKLCIVAVLKGTTGHPVISMASKYLEMEKELRDK